MTVTAPPRTVPRLECGLALEFGGGRPIPVVTAQLEALAASRLLYGQECDLSHVDSGWGNPYGAMAESVVAALGLRRDATAGPGSAVDSTIVAYDGMDCGPREHLGCRLTEVVSGRPRTFGVSGQGAAGPFTAMRIAGILVSSGRARRVLVLMLEHGQVPVDGGLPVPQRDLAVGFVVGAEGPVRLAGVEVRPSTGERSEPKREAEVSEVDGEPSGLADWARLARSLSRGTEFTLRRSEPDFGYRCELRVAP
jgi:hypothetical protein